MSSPQSKRKVAKKGGDALSQNLTGLAVPFAFLLAKQGLEAFKKDKKPAAAKDVKGKKKSVVGSKGKKRMAGGGILEDWKNKLPIASPISSITKNSLLKEAETESQRLLTEKLRLEQEIARINNDIIALDENQSKEIASLEAKILTIKNQIKNINKESDLVKDLDSKQKELDVVLQNRKDIREIISDLIKKDADDTVHASQVQPNANQTEKPSPSPAGGKRLSKTTRSKKH